MGHVRRWHQRRDRAKRNNWEWEIPWGTLIDPLAADGTVVDVHVLRRPYNTDTTMTARAAAA